MRKISRFDLFRLYLRSFFVQAGWTYERMISLGFVWILIPLAKKLFSSEKEQRDFLKRHLLSFNANPYLASYALGAVTKLEETKTPPQQIVRFKDLLRGPLGALGDNLIWQNLRPALLILGLILTFRFGVYGALSFFLIFNLQQVYLRARGIVKGYALGFRVSSDLTCGYLQNVTKWSGRMGAVLLGILIVLSYGHLTQLKSWGRSIQLVIQPPQPEKIVLLSLFILLSFLALKRNKNPNYTLLILLAFFLVIKAVVGQI
ncbi:MAG: hypothetical protein AMJ91_01820 [candidate division Zixibacteria bacterium SM23_73_3]|nr:MAG: hypothetical protein AMJ91_01820 [candidate division Zixibacteria bacterium SM23_73_3]